MFCCKMKFSLNIAFSNTKNTNKFNIDNLKYLKNRHENDEILRKL